MPDPKEPRWNLNVAAIAAIAVSVITCAATVWGKADKTEIVELDKRIHAAEKVQGVQSESQKWILEDVKKANEKLDKILDALYFPRNARELNLQPPPSTPNPNSLGR